MAISRKDFFKGLAFGTIALPFGLRALLGKAQNTSASGFLSNERYDWKMVTTWPPNFPVLGEGCQMIADAIQRMSAGRINIEVYGGGELVPALECFDAVRTGAAEMGNGAAYYWAGKVPSAQFFATVPFGMNAQEANAWILNGGGLALWQELYAEYNLVPFPAGNTGVQMGGWFNRAINSIKDFKGLKMRMPGLGGKVLERAGGTPVLLAGQEIYTGLERGIIDATEWIGPYHDYKMGFYQIAKYYYTPGWHEPGTVLEAIINKDAYDALTPDLQAIVKAACLMVNHWVHLEFEAKNNEYLQKLRAEEQVEIRSFPKDVMDTLRNITKEMLEEITANDPKAKRFYDSYQAFQTSSSSWAKIAEKAFYDDIQI